jgi:hypothetical protein
MWEGTSGSNRTSGCPSISWTGTAPANALATGAGAASTTSTTVGRFYIVYLEYNPPVADVTNPNPTRWAMSYVDTSGTLRIGLGPYFDNVWSYRLRHREVRRAGRSATAADKGDVRVEAVVDAERW